MRICFVSVMGGTPWGGSEELWYRTALLALGHGHEVIISVFEWPDEVPQIAELREKGTQVHYRHHPFRTNGQSLSLAKRVVRRLRKPPPLFLREIQEVQEMEPDVICISQGATHDLFSFKGLQNLLSFKKCVLISNGSQENYIPDDTIITLAKKYYPKIHSCVFVSKRNKNLTELQICQKLSNAKVIYNIFESPGASVLSLPPKDKECIQFALVGRIQCNHKGHHILLEILSGRNWAKRNWKLNIFGQGSDEPFVRELILFLGLKDRVVIHGQVESKKEIWDKNHILLLPSFYEGTPLVLIEAMSHGRPAVINDVGGNSEIAKHNATAFISEAPTKRHFEMAMENAWNHIFEWENMGIKAKKRISELSKITGQQQLFDILVNEN
ncbi:MAG: glycosyltransferase family 4 protein [Cyclobacteriaceae bacterium]